MTEQRCACASCSCVVDARALVRDGKAYCCAACADGHKDGEPCHETGCHCAELAQPRESRVDQALEETFPASDPISP
ncbi:metallothionein [Metapseudomonas resinovorans]|uniref:Putative metallothionein n=1 Tax=Metapseudomonas resinovorans NBRC 106553 TaxID=1245471 RepID=S6AIY4_METRE|nr:metallothionein [Pseudomonas resinovorans]BAN48405.1 putative metallothionein [Pseudomonas resinovorans NBRC 106553]